jgi:hypothetical protein
VANARSIRNGSCTVWCTTSRSSPITGMRSNEATKNLLPRR